MLLGEVEAGSLDDYSLLDSTEAAHEEDSEENHGS